MFSCMVSSGVLGPNTPSDVADKVCTKFLFMGKFVARSLMDSRMVSYYNIDYYDVTLSSM